MKSISKILFSIILLIAISIPVSAETSSPRFRNINNYGNSTTIELVYPGKIKSLSKAIFTNNGKEYKAKSVKSRPEGNYSKITMKFKRLTSFNNCYVTIFINGDKFMIPTGIAGIKSVN